MDTTPTLPSPPKCYTFAGGPTMAPQYLKSSLYESLFDPEHSLLNLNSTDKQCKQMVAQTQDNLRKLLKVPNQYRIWFCSGGAHLQFGGIAMNYGGSGGVANYATTGYFSKLASGQGAKFLKVHSMADMQKDKYGLFTLPDQYDYAPNAVYNHFVDNQTVEGLQYPDEKFPYQQGVPLLDDCSSSILTKPIPWEKVSMAYAHAQKNCGISGITILIIKDSFLKTNPVSYIPQICDFRVYEQKKGFPYPINSSAIFSIHKVTSHMLQSSTNPINAEAFRIRSQKLYQVLDRHAIYLPKVAKPYRSRINVTWECSTPELAQKCINEGIQNGLYEFKGHRTVGGFRASLFNTVCDEAVEKLVEFLDRFGEKQASR